jgi:hypothetical protein
MGEQALALALRIAGHIGHPLQESQCWQGLRLLESWSLELLPSLLPRFSDHVGFITLRWSL